MTQSLMSESLKPAIIISCDSHTAYSSAVRVEEVDVRHVATDLSPSYSAMTELVLPTSIASSMAQTLTTVPAATVRRPLSQSSTSAPVESRSAKTPSIVS